MIHLIPSGYKKGAGGKDEDITSFPVAFWQLYETYDLRTMDSETILSLLPDEFDRFQPETTVMANEPTTRPHIVLLRMRLAGPCS